ncbi:hypothetical protein N836_16010 [Leptolyngbya sp. Heron Island J]|uniref:Asr1405/Asl0597 family protein n=1 Tax=Leptolyngbya sp. Heron Island J TaxID=1385935 RepID=UPI0003B9B142|nr:Asr1405/Asl0597 family protein [Leptolyngbya sp. Heron Island J]ESA34609.1 hypothetical protein N836_16010 [Leptolyngbya sp. Heron Island J]
MDKPEPTVSTWGQVVIVPRGERWSINRRLQELHIACACPADGTLRVHVNHALELMLVHSVVRRFTLSRQVNIGWLERCWQTQVICTAKH